MELFATDYERLAFLLETDAALELDFEALEALAGEEPSPDSPPEKRPKYITNYIGSKQKLVDWIWKHTPEGVESALDAFSGSAGLMNIGRKEGSQIIQFFGGGVRLKGLDFCLKRSHRIVGLHAPKEIERLETLNEFGIHAGYMRQFKEYLEDEGLPANEDRVEFVLPVVKNLGQKSLKTIRLKEGIELQKAGTEAET